MTHKRNTPMEDNLLGRVMKKTTQLPIAETQSYVTKKDMPDYKMIKDTLFSVDAFNYGKIPNCIHYFLTHFHADHYMGLGKSFDSGTICCSQITANLVKLKLGVDPKVIQIIPMDTPTLIEDVWITFIDANHCPGAVLIIFELPDGQRFLHTGDFRAYSELVFHHLLIDTFFDIVYLDNTYLNSPHLKFPTQSKVIEQTVNKILDIQFDDTQQRLQPVHYLFMFGTYTIGKEKLFLAVAKVLGMKIYADKEKRKVLDCLEWFDLNEMLVDDPFAAQIHVVSMRDLNQESLSTRLNYLYPKFTHVVGFRPTGWNWKASESDPKYLDHETTKNGQKVVRKKVIQIHNVAYSEHSSHDELQFFCKYILAGKIVHTVSHSTF